MLAAIAPEEPEHHQASLPLPSAVRKNSPIDSLLRIAPVEFVRNQRRVVDVEESKETLDMANINGAFGTFAKAPDQFTHWMNSLGDVTARLVVLEATGEYESLLVQRLHVGERPPSPDFNLGWWYTGTGQDGEGNGDMILGTNEMLFFPTQATIPSTCPTPARFGK